jgi:hypothetical protein
MTSRNSFLHPLTGNGAAGDPNVAQITAANSGAPIIIFKPMPRSKMKSPVP